MFLMKNKFLKWLNNLWITFLSIFEGMIEGVLNWFVHFCSSFGDTLHVQPASVPSEISRSDPQLGGWGGGRAEGRRGEGGGWDPQCVSSSPQHFKSVYTLAVVCICVYLNMCSAAPAQLLIAYTFGEVSFS